jgi:hypothetical protein
VLVAAAVPFVDYRPLGFALIVAAAIGEILVGRWWRRRYPAWEDEPPPLDERILPNWPSKNPDDYR